MSSRRSRRRRPVKRKSHKKKILLAVALLAVIAVIIVAATIMGNIVPEQSEPEVPSESDSRKVLLVTTMGDIVIELRDDMPITTGNFKNLVQEGVYENTIFHRVVNLPDNLVIIQGGDPNTGYWSGGEIPSIEDEFSENSENNKNERGTIAMANTGAPNSGSSQFFINVEYNPHLDNVHPVFGDVIEGMDVVDQILQVDTDANDEPLEEVRIITAQLID